MHLLRTTPGGFVNDTQGVIRIDQRPADIVVLSSADTTLSLLASVFPRLGDGFPSVRLANVTYLRQPASVRCHATLEPTIPPPITTTSKR